MNANTPFVPARVVEQQHHYYTVAAPDGIHMAARVSGAFEYRVASRSEYPSIGDAVLVERAKSLDSQAAGSNTALIQQVLPRASVLQRLNPGGSTESQAIAANVDVALVVLALDGGRAFTAGLLLRLLTTVYAGGIRPVVVLNKCDCAEEQIIQQVTSTAHENAPEVSVHVVSAHTGAGLPGLCKEWSANQTVCLLGASGVGKSSLLNALAGRQLEREGAVRADHRGRHTTTHKKLYPLADGSSLIDLPGIRELQLWANEDAVTDSFPEIAELSMDCRFDDCSHTGEPGCAVQDALSSGMLSPERYDRYLELQREAAYVRRRVDQRAQAEEQRRWKQISRDQRSFRRRGT
ncbi:MAG: ribosome small subunit-dependent GTPase A [Spirochaetaceae bacterium]|nr:MAG: ribosome small subunit-dependent GTPase A [Spirochaetaceae bacterium]